MIIIVFGLPGSGKSYFAERLAKAIEAEYVNSDIERMKLIRHRNYTFAEKTLVYDKMLELMEAAVAKGHKIVLDATFYRESLRERFIKKAEALGETPIFIEVTAEQATIKKRLSGKREHSEADYSVYLKVKKNFEPLEQKHLVLSSDDDISTMLNTALDHIKTGEKSATQKTK